MLRISLQVAPWALLALLLVAGPATPARAQRSTAAPIYQSNLDDLFDGATEWLARREARGPAMWTEAPAEKSPSGVKSHGWYSHMPSSGA